VAERGKSFSFSCEPCLIYSQPVIACMIVEEIMALFATENGSSIRDGCTAVCRTGGRIATSAIVVSS
jgi:hypothetical protein